MSSNNSITRIINIIGAALLLLVINSNPAFGENDSFELPNPFTNPSSLSRISAEDNEVGEERALPGTTVLLRDLTFNLNYSFGVERTLDRGKEANRDVHYHFVSAEALWFLGNVGEEGAEWLRLEAGLTIGGSPHGEYHGTEGPDANMDSGDNRYHSVFRNIRIGAKFVARHIAQNGQPSIWEASINPWVGYNYERGRVGHNDPFNYRAKSITYTIGVRAQAALIFPVYGFGTEVQTTKIGGEDTTVHNGFLPRIELVAEYENAFTTKRRTTVTRLGGSDRQRNISYLARLRVHLWRFNNETDDVDKEWLLECDPVLIGHFEGRTRYGFAQVRSDHFSNRVGAGFGLHFALNRRGYLQVEGVVKKAFDNFTLGRGSDEVLGELQVNLGWSF